MAKQISLTLTVAGQVDKSPIGPFSCIYELTGQKFDWEHGIEVASTDVALTRAVPALGTQTLMLILSDQDVTYRLNGEVTNRTIKKGAKDGGFAIHPGGPNITTIQFDGNGSSAANVRIFALGQ